MGLKAGSWYPQLIDAAFSFFSHGAMSSPGPQKTKALDNPNFGICCTTNACMGRTPQHSMW